MLLRPKINIDFVVLSLYRNGQLKMATKTSNLGAHNLKIFNLKVPFRKLIQDFYVLLIYYQQNENYFRQFKKSF